MGTQETADLSGMVFPDGIAFAESLERAFVEELVTPDARQSPRAPVEVRMDYETAVAGRSVSLRQSGIFVRPVQPLPLNETLTLRFRLPGVAKEFQVQGRVVWSNSQEGGTSPLSAVRPSSQHTGASLGRGECLSPPPLMGWVPRS